MTIKKVSIITADIVLITVLFYATIWLFGALQTGEMNELDSALAMQTAGIFAFFMFGLLYFVVKKSD
jgi:hypothetical protein